MRERSRRRERRGRHELQPRSGLLEPGLKLLAKVERPAGKQPTELLARDSAGAGQRGLPQAPEQAQWPGNGRGDKEQPQYAEAGRLAPRGRAKEGDGSPAEENIK